MSLLDLFRQFSLLVTLPAVVLAALGASLIVVPRDWRIVLFGYGLLSTMLSLLLVKVIPPEWALLQAVAGGLNAVMLYLSARQLGRPGRAARRAGTEGLWPQVASLTSFRLVTVALAIGAFFLLRERIRLPETDALYRDAIVCLTMIGVLGLALHEEPLHAGLSLLTVLGGFGLLQFSLTPGRMTVGLTLSGQILLGLAISYLVLSHALPSLERNAEAGAPGWQE